MSHNETWRCVSAALRGELTSSSAVAPLPTWAMSEPGMSPLASAGQPGSTAAAEAPIRKKSSVPFLSVTAASSCSLTGCTSAGSPRGSAPLSCRVCGCCSCCSARCCRSVGAAVGYLSLSLYSLPWRRKKRLRFTHWEENTPPASFSPPTRLLTDTQRCMTAPHFSSFMSSLSHNHTEIHIINIIVYILYHLISCGSIPIIYCNKSTNKAM